METIYLKTQEVLKKSKVLFTWNLSRLTTTIAPYLAGCMASKVWFTPLRYKDPYHSPPLPLCPYDFYINGLKFLSYMPENSQPGTVVLIHGWGGSSSQFHQIKEALINNKRKVISFDFPAHGNASGFSTDIIEMKSLLEELLNRIDGPVDLICHSFGLLVAGQILRSNKNKIRSLVSISSPHTFDFLLKQFMKKAKLDKKIRPTLIEHIQNRVKNKIDVLKDIDLTSDLFEMKMLIIHDETDREIPVSEFHELRKLNQNAETLLTKGSGHNRILANSHVINSVISFLEVSQTTEFPMEEERA